VVPRSQVPRQSLWGTITLCVVQLAAVLHPHYAQRCVDPAAVLIHHAADVALLPPGALIS
jgi:hypothetical protein